MSDVWAVIHEEFRENVGAIADGHDPMLVRGGQARWRARLAPHRKKQRNPTTVTRKSLSDEELAGLMLSLITQAAQDRMPAPGLKEMRAAAHVSMARVKYTLHELERDGVIAILLPFARAARARIKICETGERTL